MDDINIYIYTRVDGSQSGVKETQKKSLHEVDAESDTWDWTNTHVDYQAKTEVTGCKLTSVNVSIQSNKTCTCKHSKSFPFITVTVTICFRLLHIAGNKKDLEDLRQVDFADARAIAQHHSMIQCLETSAKDSTNVEQTFALLAQELKLRHAGGPALEGGDSLKLNYSAKRVDGWNCCG